MANLREVNGQRSSGLHPSAVMALRRIQDGGRVGGNAVDITTGTNGSAVLGETGLFKEVHRIPPEQAAERLPNAAYELVVLTDKYPIAAVSDHAALVETVTLGVRPGGHVAAAFFTSWPDEKGVVREVPVLSNLRDSLIIMGWNVTTPPVSLHESKMIDNRKGNPHGPLDWVEVTSTYIVAQKPDIGSAREIGK